MISLLRPSPTHRTTHRHNQSPSQSNCAHGIPPSIVQASSPTTPPVPPRPYSPTARIVKNRPLDARRGDENAWNLHFHHRYARLPPPHHRPAEITRTRCTSSRIYAQESTRQAKKSQPSPPAQPSRTIMTRAQRRGRTRLSSLQSARGAIPDNERKVDGKGTGT